jgi:hypothetical protein
MLRVGGLGLESAEGEVRVDGGVGKRLQPKHFACLKYARLMRIRTFLQINRRDTLCDMGHSVLFSRECLL